MYGNNAYGTTTYGDSGKGILYVIATLALKRAIRAYISTTLILQRTIRKIVSQMITLKRIVREFVNKNLILKRCINGFVSQTLTLKRTIYNFTSQVLTLKRTILRLGMIKPISYIKKSNIHLGVSSLIVKSKVLKENIISKFK